MLFMIFSAHSEPAVEAVSRTLELLADYLVIYDML